MDKNSNLKVFLKGMKDGIPIALGYFAVAFSLGIAAKNSGLTAFQGFLVSLLNNASAGEYAGFKIIESNGSYIELILVILIANGRYFLMGTAMSQRLDPQMKWYHRILMGYELTDEVFGICIAQPGYLKPLYTYGASVIAIPCWAIGTMFGIIAGNLLQLSIISALSVALYGMFIAVIVPPCKKNKILIGIILACFLFSYLFSIIPILNNISNGIRIIILTVGISCLAAVIFPVKDQEKKENGEK